MSATDPCALDDTVMLARFKEIVAEYRIQAIIETGIHHGLSTVLLSEMAPTVFAIDNYWQSLMISAVNLTGRKNVVLCAGNSPDVLWALRSVLPDQTLYFLDAHWQDYWPLLDEIKTIKPGTGVIVLHDIVVPSHPELGFDAYKGQPLDYAYVKDVLTQWSPTHRVEYNTKSEGTAHPRGVAYIYPR